MSRIAHIAIPSRLVTVPLLAGALVLAGNLAGCSGSNEDVRVTLCKDLVAVQLGGSPGRSWTEASTETRGYQYARVKLRWSAADGDGSASCFYDYNAVEDTAMALSDPLSSYSASPSKMVLNGNTLSRHALAEAVKQAMLKQGKALVDQVKSRL